MSRQLYTNNAKTTLSSSVGPTDTTIQVASGALFPTPSNGTYFKFTIDTGTSVEIIEATGNTGTSFTGCTRGVEGTTAQNFQPGTKVELRWTAGTISTYLREQDMMVDIATIDALLPPDQSDSNSYVIAAGDDAGNPVVSIDHNDFTWGFPQYPSVITSGTATVATSSGATSLSLTNASTVVSQATAGKYIIQFTSGANRGYCRAVTNTTSSAIQWATGLPGAINIGDGYSVYQSASSLISALNAASGNGLVYAILFGE
jgi:hypothetical protein